MTNSGWTSQDLPSLDGRTVVVTGSTSGIGRAAASEFSRAGADVVLAVRNLPRGEQVAAEMPGKARALELDLADLASVRAFASAWDGDIDILVNNAGVMAVPLSRTADGFELHMGTNHLGHFALANLLLDRVTDRVVVVASAAHRQGRIDLDDLNWERRRYRRWPAYAQSKLSNLLFMSELQRRLEAAGSGVIAVAAHPGYAATELQGRSGLRFWDLLGKVGNRLVAQDALGGAQPTLYAATQDIPGDSYIGPDGRSELRGKPAFAGRNDRAKDAEMAAGLWELSERLTGVGATWAASAAPRSQA